MDNKEDLNVDGPYSPISLDKVSKLLSKDVSKGCIKVLLEQDGSGFENDCPDMASITIKDRADQAEYLAGWIAKGGKIPDYLYKYLAYFFEYIQSKDLDDENLKIESKWIEEFNTKIKYWKSNAEVAQLTGLIILFYEALNFEKEFGKLPKLWIEHPETSLHPKRERCVMLVLNHILKSFGKDA